jgi:hypothetical protein
LSKLDGSSFTKSILTGYQIIYQKSEMNSSTENWVKSYLSLKIKNEFKERKFNSKISHFSNLCGTYLSHAPTIC